MGDPILVDESLEQLDPETIQAGDVVGISVHTGNALRGYAVGRLASERGATVVYGGIHATLFPDEPFEYGAADAVVKGDGDVAWGQVLRDIQAGRVKRIYEGGKIEGEEFLAARWDLVQADKYMWASVQTIRGCPKHCSFCSVWRTDGQKPRQRPFENVIDEIIDLRRRGFRFIALADDNFYPVTLTDLRLAREQNNPAKLESLTQIRGERFSLMAELAKLPKDMVFFTQITMESAEDRGVSGRHAEGQYQRRPGGRGGRDAGRSEGGLQGLQLFRGSAGGAVADIPQAWRACAGLFHLRSPNR